MLPDHFHHHDGVVHHEAHRDGQRHQGQIIQAEMQREHHGGGAQQRQRNHRAGDQGGADVEQEQEDHQHHQGDRDQQGDFHIRHRGADGLGAVHQDIDVDAGRDIGLQARQRGADLVDRVDHIGAGRLEDHQQDALSALHGGIAIALAGIDPGADLVVLDAGEGLADVLDAHRRAVLIAHHQIVPWPGIQNLVIGIDGEIALRSHDRALGRIDRGGDDLLAHGVDLKSARGDLARIDLDAHRRFLLAADSDQAHAVDARDLLRQDHIGIIVHLVQRQCVGTQRQDHDRRVRRIDLADGGLGRKIGRQLRAGGVDRGLDLLEIVGEIFAINSNCRVMLVEPSAFTDVIWVMPGISENWRSSGVATLDAMVSGLAPGSEALICRVGKSTLGSDATGSSE